MLLDGCREVAMWNDFVAMKIPHTFCSCIIWFRAVSKRAGCRSDRGDSDGDIAVQMIRLYSCAHHTEAAVPDLVYTGYRALMRTFYATIPS